MPPMNAKKVGEKKTRAPSATAPPSPADDLTLHGDLSELTYAFVGKPRRLVTCPVPDSIYLKLQAYPGGVSRFYEDAIASFNGDLRELVKAAVSFIEERRYRSSTDPPRNASGRVKPNAFAKIEQIQGALSGIRGMSRAKVIAGLISLHLNTKKTP